MPTDNIEALKFVRLAVRAYPELYFARFVVLGEGDSERIVLPRVAESMGVALDSSFVPVVPLGGRYIDHFWRLLNDLRIPHITLLDLDFGRRHGGARLIRSIVKSLAKVGINFKDTIDQANLEMLDDASLMDSDSSWLQALQDKGIFFSQPLDLDFAMLMAFSAAYQQARPNRSGPRTDAADIQSKKKATLKTEGNSSLYDAAYDDHFLWYPYLFNKNKPEAHLVALVRIDSVDLARNAFASLRTLIERIQSIINPHEDA